MGSVERWSETEFGVRLRDGRVLGCREHGDPAGKPMLWFHGTPGSRMAALPEAARRGRLRVMVVERPGYGRSTARPRRRILDWADDVGELLDVLGLDRVALAGNSGAGPYLAACARRMPERVERVAMIACIAPIADGAPRDGLSFRRRLVFGLAGAAPRLFERSLVARGFADPERAYREVTADAPPCDRAIIERTWREQVEMMREALRQGVDAFAWDMHLAARPWGFRLEDIRAEVHVFIGLDDRATPPAMGRYLAARIPAARAHEISGAGHFLAADHWGEIAAVLEAPAMQSTAAS